MEASKTLHQIIHLSTQSEIISVLEKNLFETRFNDAILSGSRAARYYLPNFRETFNTKNIDWDIICSSKYLLNWLREKGNKVQSIEMMIPTTDGEFDFDLYIYCTLSDGSKYDFINLRTTASYTAYILDNFDKWTTKRVQYCRWEPNFHSFEIASVKLLFIFKKYMLYYTHQWRKTAKDYRELLTIADPLTDDDIILCDLFNQYNEKLFGRCSSNMDEFVIIQEKDSHNIVINRDDFLTQDKNERTSRLYQIALSISLDNDILIGLEQLCTKSPLWLSDYVINNWIAIQNEKIKQRPLQLPYPCTEVQVDNYCLFEKIPEIPTRQILKCITRAVDFYNMQFVCKRWYKILHQESFWRDLHISHYGDCLRNTDNSTKWKRLYFDKLNGENMERKNKHGYFVDATIKLRQCTANDVLKLWEDLTHQEQSVDPAIMSNIDFILANSIYTNLTHKSDHYSAKLIVVGLEDFHSSPTSVLSKFHFSNARRTSYPPSKPMASLNFPVDESERQVDDAHPAHTVDKKLRTTVHLELEMGEYGKISRFSDYMEILSVTCHCTDGGVHSLKFSGQELFGFYMYSREYGHVKGTKLGSNTCSIFPAYPSGLLVCLFAVMTHPSHREEFIKYLKNLENHCLPYVSYEE
ncbi:unnamed protein product [Rotaria sp. Silwood2]|nr:unnamed protein product [Rotaria sp. Silwood2]